MTEIDDRSVLDERLHELDAMISAFHVRRQYAAGQRYALHLDQKIAELWAERARVAGELHAAMEHGPQSIVGSTVSARRAA